jgi:cytidylate kinase
MGTFIPQLQDYEEDLLKKFSTKIKKRTKPIIAIGGFSGTGKDTVARFVQLYFQENYKISLKITGSGDFVRKIAIQTGWEEKNLDKFMKHIQTTQHEDFAKKIDLEIEKQALKNALLEGGIFIGRLAPYAIGTHGITIWLEVAAAVIADRISQDKNRSEYGMNKEELIQRIRSRDKTDGERLEQIYGISFRDKKKFDLILRNEGFTLLELKMKVDEFLSVNLA